MIENFPSFNLSKPFLNLSSVSSKNVTTWQVKQGKKERKIRTVCLLASFFHLPMFSLVTNNHKIFQACFTNHKKSK